MKFYGTFYYGTENYGYYVLIYAKDAIDADLKMNNIYGEDCQNIYKEKDYLKFRYSSSFKLGRLRIYNMFYNIYKCLVAKGIIDYLYTKQ